jgi:hypothetical protein
MCEALILGAVEVFFAQRLNRGRKIPWHVLTTHSETPTLLLIG